MYYFHSPILGTSKMYSHQPLSQRSSSDLSKETLLEKDEFDTRPPPRKTWHLLAWAMVLQGILIAVYTIVSLAAVQKAQQRIADINSDRIDSPAWPVIKNVQKTWDPSSSLMDDYFGFPPTETIDNRWIDILKYGNFKFSAEEMTRWDRIQEGVQLSDDSGYMGTLNVFHELHCLRRIYMYIHKEKYFDPMNLTKYEKEQNLNHMMHCMEGIRQGIQCRSDITPVTFYWIKESRLPVANWSSPHQCRDWNALFSWGKENSFDPFSNPGLVKHPMYGDPYSGDPDISQQLGVVLNQTDNKNDV